MSNTKPEIDYIVMCYLLLVLYKVAGCLKNRMVILIRKMISMSKKNDLGPWNREDICTSEICKACNNSILPKSNCLESDYVIFDCRDKTY